MTWSKQMRVLGLAISTILLSSSFAWADVKVAVSIKPIHSLVATVMQGVGTPTLIVDGSNSPHTYSMKPSDATALEQAQVIFWVGHQLEAFLEKPIETLGNKAKIVSLIDSKNIVTRPVREDGNFAGHEEEGEHHHDGADAHIWLDPENAKAILSAVAQALVEVDPDNAATYTANAQKAATDIDAMTAEIKTIISPAKGQGFLVFHDAYQYFEKRFDMAASGAISINPENAPGAATVSQLRQQIADGKIKCVFSEPQFDTKLTTLLLEGSRAKAAVLDPLGANLDPGPALYAKLMRNLAGALSGCLAPT
jgi:zinc transport system substrate-binding protein